MRKKNETVSSKWTLKDKLDMAEAIFTIIVSLMAIWGTIVAWENGFLHKIKYIADHVHAQYIASEQLKNTEIKLEEVQEKIKKDINEKLHKK